ncbi:hypothetical protein SARC_01649 [Sphaeroforma arctica JP610]|uniref:Serine/threonine-protein phosphatase 4 regulatory subunit 3-like central domain-containing protein n=1 Tax=Sphaeroforma arctica JP610 TaxID=667725 RepID=A0A0L0GBA5_9EUKA|nr:hypothetical protein SARC_01649 [Sphaeroforma arctica JP610]KNC86171.1 hypothetical protein SARC_01649 [Sphaeroforma arctica JP610]|eukprot:XP_014160073.1 hypothetical protein SARC_01649 [Sphaeroforma arctica JP610]
MASNFVAFNKGEIAKSIVEEESAWIDTVFKVLRTPHKSLATAGTGAICRQTYGATTTNGHTSHTPAHSIESSGAAGLPTETERDNGMDTGEVAENRVYSLEEKRHLTLTIRDLLAMCSHSHEAAFRLNVRTKLMEAGLVDIIAVCMSSPDDETRLAATDSIHILLIMDGEAFRQLVRTQYETYTKHAAGEEKDALRNSMLLRVIVHRIVHDSDGSVKALCAEILKSLFDSTAMEGSITDKRSFQSILYNDSFELLVSPLEEYTPGPSDMSMEEAECRTNTIQIIIELLTFFVTRHGYELRNRVLREFLIVKAMSYLSSPETLLKLCAVRFLRPIVGMQDGFYNRHLVENKILIRLTQALIANGPWYNMVHSAILDVLDTVVESSTTVLIDSLVVDLFSTIANVEFTDVFGKFITNYANRHPAEHQRLIVQQQSHVSNPPTSPSTDNESLNETPRGMSITTPSVLSVPTQAAAQLDSSTNTNRFTGVTTNTHNDVDIELDLDTEEGGASMDVMATEDTMEVPETSGFVGAVDGNNLDDTGADTQLADMSMGEDSDIWQSAGVNVKEAVDTHMSTDTNTNAHGIPSL